MLAVAETISKVATHASSFIGIACIAASLLSNSWTVSDVVYTGLTLRCVNYPGISDCRTIEGADELNQIYSRIAATVILNVLAYFIVLSARCETMCKSLAALVYLTSGATALSGVVMYKKTFTLCSSSHLGPGYTQALVGGIFNLFACAFCLCYLYYSTRPQSKQPEDIKQMKKKNRPKKKQHKKKKEGTQVPQLA